MADIWIPGWPRHVFGLRGKPYQYTHNPKGCLHTTEGGSIGGALNAYAPYPPHGIYDWRSRERVQHIPLNLASYSAMDGNDDDYMVQIELVGFANDARNWPDEALRNIAEDVLKPLEDLFGIPRQSVWHGFKDGRDGIYPYISTPQSPIRLSAAQLRDFSGWLGHQHLPAPDNHWDPGAIPIQRIFNYMEGEDEMTVDELLDAEVPQEFSEEIGQALGIQPDKDGKYIKTGVSLRVLNRWSDNRHESLKAEVVAVREELAEIRQLLSTGGVDVQALANALASPLGNHVRDALGAEVYAKLLEVVKNIKLSVAGSGGL